jgi:hypothetical protein
VVGCNGCPVLVSPSICGLLLVDLALAHSCVLSDANRGLIEGFEFRGGEQSCGVQPEKEASFQRSRPTKAIILNGFGPLLSGPHLCLACLVPSPGRRYSREEIR